MIWLINENNTNQACLCHWWARRNKLLVDELSNSTKFVWQQIIRASPRLLGQPDTSDEYSCEGAQMPCAQGQRMEVFLQNGKFCPGQQWPEKNWRWWRVISETPASVSPSGQQDWPMVPAVVPTQRWGGAGGWYNILFVLGTKATVPSTSSTHRLRKILKYWDFRQKKPNNRVKGSKNSVRSAAQRRGWLIPDLRALRGHQELGHSRLLTLPGKGKKRSVVETWSWRPGGIFYGLKTSTRFSS